MTTMDWTLFDFLVFGAMLLGAGGAWGFLRGRDRSRDYRAAAGIAIVSAFLMVWIDLAVGIIGREGDPENLLFAGVLGVACVGSLLARFRPQGMARAFAATAAAQAVVAVAAFALGSAEGTLLSLAFVGAWLASAFLFRRAARAAAT